MRLFLIFTLFCSFLFSSDENSFITKKEYGEMLYKNPRGIGCIKCHAQNGSGSLIARYKDKKGVTQTLRAPSINKIPYQKFRAKLKNQRNSSKIMPTYFLTDEEINSIYFYLTNKTK